MGFQTPGSTDNRRQQSIKCHVSTGANAVLATKCCFENMRWPDFLDWRASHAAAAQPKKTGCTRSNPADMRLRAAQDGDTYRISGTKHFISTIARSRRSIL